MSFLPGLAESALDFAPAQRPSGPGRPELDPGLATALFDAGADAALYAVLDPGKALFLAERLRTEHAAFAPLFRPSRVEGMDEVSPLVARLDPGSRLTASLFALEEVDGPRALLDKDAGLLLRSDAPLDEIVDGLRRFTRAKGEAQSRSWFRFWEPAMLYGVLSAAPAGAARGFFERSRVSEALWTEESLHDGIWTLRGIAPGPGLEDVAPAPLIIGPAERAGLRHQVNRRLAREMARQRTPDPALRADMAATFTPLRDADYDSEFSMDSFWRLLGQIPAADHPGIWAEVETHRFALAMINRLLADHYGLEFRVPKEYEGMGA